MASHAEQIERRKKGEQGFGRASPYRPRQTPRNGISLQYSSGGTLARSYAELNGVLGHEARTKQKKIVSIIDDELPESFSRSVAVRSFRRQAAGWKDQTPVVYPGAPEGSSSQSDVKDHPTLQWFKKREDNRTKLYTLMTLIRDLTDAEQTNLEELEKEFGKYRFPTLLS